MRPGCCCTHVPHLNFFLKPEILNYKLQIKSATMLPNDLRKKKQKNKKQKQIFRAVVKEAQVLVAFETFFFNFALNFWVFETFKKNRSDEILCVFGVGVWVFRFYVFRFFFFLLRVNNNLTCVYCAGDKNYCSHIIYHCSQHCSRIKKILKIGPTVLFIHLKNILL